MGLFSIDIYDLATKTLDKRGGVRAESWVSAVGWLGKRIFYTSCVDAGPGCSPFLWDPETEKATRLAANMYGVDLPAHHASGSTWAFVDSTGGQIVFADVETGQKKPALQIAPSSDTQNGVSVAPREGSEIAIVSGAPQAGTVVVVDLAGPKVVKKYVPTACK